MQIKLGRELNSSLEEVDHINELPFDNEERNFQLLTPEENKKKSLQYRPKKKMFKFICPVCGNEGEKEYSQYKRDQLEQKKAGPFCNKSCSGKASNGGWDK